MSATETAAVVVPAAAPVDEVPPAVVENVEEPATAPEVVPTVVEAEAATVEPTATEEPAKSESKADDEPKKDVPKGPNFLNKFFSTFKVDRKPKSPKKEKKKEEVEATATAEAPKDAEVPGAEAPAEVPAEVVETVKEAEPVVAEPAPAPEVPVVVTEEVKETPAVTPAKALKVGRRISARVGDFFKSKSKTEVTAPAKVNEHPPKIDEPEAIAPLENPASEAAKAEELKPADVSVPVVAATA